MSGSHYSLAFDKRLFLFAKAAKELIIKHFYGRSVGLYFTGFSGVSHGLAVYHLFLHCDDSGVNVSAAYVRKENEESHGKSVEVSGPIPNICIFIDDFIDSGETLQFCTNKIKKSFIRNRKTEVYSITADLDEEVMVKLSEVDEKFNTKNIDFILIE